MRWIVLLAALYLAAVVETSLADTIRVGAVGPDLLALVAIAWVLLCGGPRGFLVAGLLGLTGDLLAPGRPGFGMALLLVIGYVITRARSRLPLEHAAWQTAVVGTGTIWFASGLAISRWVAGETPVPLGCLLMRSVGVGIYTAGVAVPILLVAGWLREPFQLRRKRLATLKA